MPRCSPLPDYDFSQETGIFRKIILHGLALLILITTFALTRIPGTVKGYLYTLFREAVKINIMLRTCDWNTLESRHFMVRYKPGEKENARLVLDTAEFFLDPVAGKYDFPVKDKIPLILYSSREELNASFGWPSSERAMGVYWGGVIRILSPDEWINYSNFKEKRSIFMSSGPVAHELVHLVVDYRSKGNCPRWFTEGLAQYEEYRLTGFRFKGPEAGWARKVYPLRKLDKDFDSLPNQSLAYRQSLSAVEYILEVYGEDKLHNIINGLARGWSMNRTMADSLGVDIKEFEQNWHRWLKDKEK